MTGYLINFSIYTMAMIGVIFIALYTFKAFSGTAFQKKSSQLNIEDTMKLSARKSLYVINAQGERFLIASDIDRTSLISKLGEKEIASPLKLREDKSFELKSFDAIESMDEFASIIDFQKKKEKKGPMMRELARKLKSEV